VLRNAVRLAGGAVAVDVYQLLADEVEGASKPSDARRYAGGDGIRAGEDLRLATLALDHDAPVRLEQRSQRPVIAPVDGPGVRRREVGEGQTISEEVGGRRQMPMR
jgi:hypothetical protein